MNLIRRVSFHQQLTGELQDFLKAEGIQCAATTETLVELVAALGNYREEGVRLFPHVFLCNDMTRIVKRLGSNSNSIEIGSGQRNAGTIRDVLKKCAALAQGGWAIFVERTASGCRYGLFSASGEPLSLPIPELVLSVTEADYPVILVSQLAENIVEVRSASGQQVYYQLTAGEGTQYAPTQALDGLVGAATAEVSVRNQEQVAVYLRRTLAIALRNGHGALVGVVSRKQKRLPDKLQDGVVLARPLNLGDLVADYMHERTVDRMDRLQSASVLMSGMLSSDGITVFRSDASLLAYRVFVRAANKPGVPTFGGARRRAFATIEAMVGRGLAGAFYQSQDGRSEFKRG